MLVQRGGSGGEMREWGGWVMSMSSEGREEKTREKAV